MNTIGYFEIQSSEPEREIVFYQDIFGWKFVKEENLPIDYYRIETKSMNGGLLKRPAPLPPEGTGTNAYVCSVEVENFDKTAEHIISKGGRISLPKFAIYGVCWQGYFLDKDNNTFGLFQVDEKAE
jgi:uncharacterized protein